MASGLVLILITRRVLVLALAKELLWVIRKLTISVFNDELGANVWALAKRFV